MLFSSEDQGFTSSELGLSWLLEVSPDDVDGIEYFLSVETSDISQQNSYGNVINSDDAATGQSFTVAFLHPGVVWVTSGEVAC